MPNRRGGLPGSLSQTSGTVEALIGPLAKGISSSLRPRYCSHGASWARAEPAHPIGDARTVAIIMHRSCMPAEFETEAMPTQCTPLNHASCPAMRRYADATMVASLIEFATQGRAGVCRLACFVLAALAALCAPAEARTGRVVLVVTGDERMSEELKKLVETSTRTSRSTGDSLALLQGAQARAAKVNARCARAASTTPWRRPRSPTSRSRRPPPSMPSTQTRRRTSSLSCSRRDRPALQDRRHRLPRSGPPVLAGDRHEQVRPRRRRAGRRGCHPDRRRPDPRPGPQAAAMPWRWCGARCVIDHATREAADHLHRRHRARSPRMGAGELLRHRKGRHDLPAAPRAVQGGRALQAGQGGRAARPPDRRSACSARCASSPPRRSTPRASCRSTSRSRTGCRARSASASATRRMLGFGRERLLAAPQPVRRGREPEADRRGQSHRPGRRIPADLGYAFKADFLKPDWWLSGRTRRHRPQVLREVLPAYTREAVAAWRRPRPHLSAASGGVGSGSAREVSQVARHGITAWLLQAGRRADVGDPERGRQRRRADQGLPLAANVTPYADISHDNDSCSPS